MLTLRYNNGDHTIREEVASELCLDTAAAVFMNMSDDCDFWLQVIDKTPTSETETWYDYSAGVMRLKDVFHEISYPPLNTPFWAMCEDGNQYLAFQDQYITRGAFRLAIKAQKENILQFLKDDVTDAVPFFYVQVTHEVQSDGTLDKIDQRRSEAVSWEPLIFNHKTNP